MCVLLYNYLFIYLCMYIYIIEGGISNYLVGI